MDPQPLLIDLYILELEEKENSKDSDYENVGPEILSKGNILLSTLILLFF